MIEVSIIVPIYNAEKYLDKCIKSILNQTYSNFELILVNDGSTDSSLDICNKYSSKDKRIVVINQKNLGCIKARSNGIKASKFKYITFVDADDWVNKRMLEITTESIEKENPDVLVFNSYKVISSFGLIKKCNDSIYFIEDKIYESDEVKNKLVAAYLHGYPFPCNLWGKVYKKEYLIECGKYLKEITFMGEDLYYNIEIFLKAKRVLVINRKLYFYRLGGNTYKYMPYLFEDAIAGYKVQIDVINEFFSDSKEHHMNGINVMLIGLLKTSIENLSFTQIPERERERERRSKIGEYIENRYVLEAINNIGVRKCYDEKFLKAIKDKDIDYLYELSDEWNKKFKRKNMIFNILKKA